MWNTKHKCGGRETIWWGKCTSNIMMDVVEVCNCQCRKWCNSVSLDFGLLTLQTGLNNYSGVWSICNDAYWDFRRGVGKEGALARASLMAAKAAVVLSFQGMTLVLYLESVTTCWEANGCQNFLEWSGGKVDHPKKLVKLVLSSGLEEIADELRFLLLWVETLAVHMMSQKLQLVNPKHTLECIRTSCLFKRSRTWRRWCLCCSGLELARKMSSM